MTDVMNDAPEAGLIGQSPGPKKLKRAANHALEQLERVASGLPYRFADAVAVVASGQAVWIADTEADVDALCGVGAAACSPKGGLAKWRDEDTEALVDAQLVVVVAPQSVLTDAWTVAAALYRGGVTASAVRVLTAPSSPTVAEFLAAHGLDDFEPAPVPEYAELDLTTSSGVAHITTGGPAGPGGPAGSLPWEDPVPFEWGGSYGPPFPVEALPEWIGRQATEAAEQFQAPVDLAAMVGIGALSVAALNRLAFARPGGSWQEFTNLFLATSLASGEGKSPTYKVMADAVWELERRMCAGSRVRREDAELEHDRLKAQIDAARAAVLSSEDGDPQAKARLRALREQLDAHVVPPDPGMFTDDATPDALSVFLARHGGRAAVLTGETDVFAQIAGKYSRDPNLGIFLRTHSGDRHIQDRITRERVHIKAPIMTIAVATQPKALNRFATNPSIEGLGILERFMFALPRTTVGSRDRKTRRRIPESHQKAYDRQMLRLGLALQRSDKARVVTFTGRADELFDDWDQETEYRLHPSTGDLAEIAPWVQKLRSSTLRLAALLHVAEADEDDDQVPVETMRRALTIAAYWIDHSSVIHSTWTARPDQVAKDAGAILGWISANPKERSSFTPSTLTKVLRRRFYLVKQTVAPLQLLEDTGWIRGQADWSVGIGNPGHRSPTLTVVPDVRKHLERCGLVLTESAA